MAVTPQEAELAQYQELSASLRHWENAIDAMLKKGGRVFHFTNPEFLQFIPILMVRYYKHGWLIQDGGKATDGETRRLIFAARQDMPPKETPNEQPSA